MKNRPADKVVLYMDGDQWCCGIGENLQEGQFEFAAQRHMAVHTFRFRHLEHESKPVHLRACRRCGCTDDHACYQEHDPFHSPACRWIEWNLCSFCTTETKNTP